MPDPCADVLAVIFADVLVAAPLHARAEQKRTLRLVDRHWRDAFDALPLTDLSASSAAGVKALARRLQNCSPTVRSLALRIEADGVDGVDIAEATEVVLERCSATLVKLELDLAVDLDVFDCSHVLGALGPDCPLRRVELAGPSFGSTVNETLLLGELLSLRHLAHVGTATLNITRRRQGRAQSNSITIRERCDLRALGRLIDVARPVGRLDLGTAHDVRTVDSAAWHGIEELRGRLDGTLSSDDGGGGLRGFSRLRQLELLVGRDVDVPNEIVLVALCSTVRSLVISSIDEVSINDIAVALASVYHPRHGLRRLELDAPVTEDRIAARKAIDSLSALGIEVLLPKDAARCALTKLRGR